MKTVTTSWLKKDWTCRDAMEKLEDMGYSKLLADEMIRLCIEEDRLDWASWLICRVLNKRQKVQYAVYAARYVLKISEDKDLEFKRPRKAIEAAEAYLKRPCKKTIDAAETATKGYNYAMEYVASFPPVEAADESAYAASCAACENYAAATCSSWAAAHAAIHTVAEGAKRKKLQIKFINYGIKLLKGKEGK